LIVSIFYIYQIFPDLFQNDIQTTFLSYKLMVNNGIKKDEKI